MKFDVWVRAEGEGTAPDHALERAKSALGECCVDVSSVRDEWTAHLRIEADAIADAIDDARARVQAVVGSAGLPDWPLSRANASGEVVETVEGFGTQEKACWWHSESVKSEPLVPNDEEFRAAARERIRKRREGPS